MNLSRGQLTSGLTVLVATLFLACGGKADGDGTTAVIGPEGGTITSTDGSIVLEIPAGALIRQPRSASVEHP